MNGVKNPNYKNGNRMTGNFPCPMCECDRVTEQRYADRMCRKCYNKSRSLGLTKEERRARYTKTYREKRRLFKDEVIQMYGDKCWVCRNTYPSCVYTFHHLEPDKKDVNPSTVFRTSSWKKVETELRKCMMICHNCHLMVHWGSVELNMQEILEKISNVWDNRESLTYS